MKIKQIKSDYESVMALPRPAHKKPHKPNIFFRTLIRVASMPDLLLAKFSYVFPNKKEILREPCLILMNHSSFIDLEISSAVLYPHAYCIVSTTDGLVGKEWLMRQIGCIPTQKFVSDLRLIRDLKYALKEKKTHVLMFPEAGYSFDGRATALPQKMGSFLKLLDVPVVMIQANGAFLRDPLYNGLQKRKVKVSADCRLLLSREELKTKSAEEIEAEVKNAFSFDQFAWQRESGVAINEKFRADGLERILYKCAACESEGTLKGEGITLTCSHCKKTYELTPLGELAAIDGETRFAHVSDWYDWERESVKKELLEGRYLLDTEVEIGMLVNHKALYMVGEGRLIHNQNGFLLTGCDGKLRYEQKPLFSHSLNSDFYWYEIGDVIGIGNAGALYYCFPKKESVVTKARLAAEELYLMQLDERRVNS